VGWLSAIAAGAKAERVLTRIFDYCARQIDTRFGG